MRYLSHSKSGIFIGPIALLPPRLKTWLSNYKVLYSIIVASLMLSCLGLLHFLELKLDYLLPVLALALILLLNVYLYVIRLIKETVGISIWIDLDEIQLLKKGVILYKEYLKNLRVILQNEAGTANNTPIAIQIEGKYFPQIIIRFAPTFKSRQFIRKADFYVTSEKEWGQLVHSLAYDQEPALYLRQA